MKKLSAKEVQEIAVVDPDSGGVVRLTLLKLESGGMVAVDSSFLSQKIGPVYSPFDKNVVLEIQ